ncbi:MAG: nucleotidyltransferase domain-containing protein [Nitrososphaerales archaeon]
MAIFGSFVRGEQKSDIDIAIEFDKNKGKSPFKYNSLDLQQRRASRSLSFTNHTRKEYLRRTTLSGR